MTTKTKVQEAREAIQPAIKALCEMGARCMEQVEDSAGVIVERWLLPNGKSAIVYGTPHWRDVFLPASDENKWDATIAALKKFAASN